MNLEDIKINFDVLFKERIGCCAVYETWQKPHVRDACKYFWYELPRTDSSEPWVVVFNPNYFDKDIKFLMEFEGEDIIGCSKCYNGSTWVPFKFRENSKCITEEEFKIGPEKFNMSKWWDDCVCDYLKRINTLQNTQKKFRKLKLKDPRFVKNLHKEIRNICL